MRGFGSRLIGALLRTTEAPHPNPNTVQLRRIKQASGREIVRFAKNEYRREACVYASYRPRKAFVQPRRIGVAGATGVAGGIGPARATGTDRRGAAGDQRPAQAACPQASGPGGDLAGDRHRALGRARRAVVVATGRRDAGIAVAGGRRDQAPVQVGIESGPRPPGAASAPAAVPGDRCHREGQDAWRDV